MIIFQDIEDFNQLKILISNHVHEKTGRNYPPVLILVNCLDENNSLKKMIMKFEKENEIKLEHIDDFDSNKFFGAIYEMPDFDCCSLYGKSLRIFVKKLF